MTTDDLKIDPNRLRLAVGIALGSMPGRQREQLKLSMQEHGVRVQPIAKEPGRLMVSTHGVPIVVVDEAAIADDDGRSSGLMTPRGVEDLPTVPSELVTEIDAIGGEPA